MFDNHNFYTFILLFLFTVLLNIFNIYITHTRVVTVILLVLLAVPVCAFGYLVKYQNSPVGAFYVMFTAVLIMYILVLVISRIYPLLHEAGKAGL